MARARDLDRPWSPLAMALHRWALHKIDDAALALAAVEAMEACR